MFYLFRSGRRAYFFLEIPRPENGATYRHLSAFSDRGSMRQRWCIGLVGQFLNQLLERLEQGLPLNRREGVDLSVVDHELAGRLPEAHRRATSAPLFIGRREPRDGFAYVEHHVPEAPVLLQRAGDCRARLCVRAGLSILRL